MKGVSIFDLSSSVEMYYTATILSQVDPKSRSYVYMFMHINSHYYYPGILVAMTTHVHVHTHATRVNLYYTKRLFALLQLFMRMQILCWQKISC